MLAHWGWPKLILIVYYKRFIVLLFIVIICPIYFKSYLGNDPYIAKSWWRSLGKLNYKVKGRSQEYGRTVFFCTFENGLYRVVFPVEFYPQVFPRIRVNLFHHHRTLSFNDIVMIPGIPRSEPFILFKWWVVEISLIKILSRICV